MTITVLQSVVMAGGSGTRLWPLSRAGHSKRFPIRPGCRLGADDIVRFEDTYGRA